MKFMTKELSAVNKCGHVFHTHCILQQIETNGNCPMCRGRVNKNDKFNIVEL